MKEKKERKLGVAKGRKKKTRKRQVNSIHGCTVWGGIEHKALSPMVPSILPQAMGFSVHRTRGKTFLSPHTTPHWELSPIALRESRYMWEKVTRGRGE